jgi:hypothetical protein
MKIVEIYLNNVCIFIHFNERSQWCNYRIYYSIDRLINHGEVIRNILYTFILFYDY